MNSEVNFATAFLAGLVSFVSPCVLPLVPSYLSLLTGTSVDDLRAEQSTQAKTRVLAHALAFIAGLTTIFVLLGLSASAIGALLADNKDSIARVGGAIIVILGLNMMGIFKIPALMMDKRFHFKRGTRSPDPPAADSGRSPYGAAGLAAASSASPDPSDADSGGTPRALLTSFVVGVTFAAGWTPCIGPILSGILVLASSRQPAEGAALLLVYSVGLGLGFLVAAAALTQSLAFMQRIKRFLPAIETTSGAILVATGIVLATGSFTRFQGFFNQYIKVPFS